MMTPTTRLEGLLPADGAYTKTDQIIAEAVEELRDAEDVRLYLNRRLTQADSDFTALSRSFSELARTKQRTCLSPWHSILAFALGIAVGLLAGWVW